MKRGIDRYLACLAAVFAAVWIWAAINPVMRRDWLLENLLVVVMVPLLILGGRYFRLSRVSYTLITVFLVLHLVGSHYTYSEVPIGERLSAWFGSDRNMYDRFVHFSYGFLLAYPVREMFLRVSRVRGFWGYYLPLDVTLALSGTFEILEMIVAAFADPEAGVAYLGAQGDVWDSQKDMLVAGLGALIAMIIVAMINWKLNPAFWREMRASFRLPKDDEPLGEVKLEQMLDKKK